MEVSSEGGKRRVWWMHGLSMAPRMRMKSCRGGGVARNEAGNNKAMEIEWGSNEYDCIVEEEEPEVKANFDWKTFYQKETPGEIEEMISEMENELMMSVQLEHGPIPMDHVWIIQTLMARALQERQSFGRVVGVALSSWKEDDSRRWSIMADI